MATIIGLFLSQKDAKHLSVDLENAGFRNEDYIVYLNHPAAEKPNLWERLFGGRNPRFINTVHDKLITSVAVNNDEQAAITKEIYKKYQAIHIYEFNDLSIEDAKCLNYVKTKVRSRAKAQVYSSLPKTEVFKYEFNPGMVSRVQV